MKSIFDDFIYVQFQIIGFPDYAITNDGRVVQLAKFEEVTQKLVGYTVGYYLNRKFVSSARLKTLLFEVDLQIVKRTLYS